MFGGIKTNIQTQGSNSMFGNPFQQQQPQQQQQPIQSVFTNSNTQLQPPQQPSRFEKYKIKDTTTHNIFANDSENTSSVTNDNSIKDNSSSSSGNISSIKKRSIPNHLVKRISKVNNNSNEEDKSLTPILPFKASTQIQPDTFSEDFAYLYKQDKPPNKSLFDPTIFQDEITPGEMLMGDSVFNKMNENPINFENIFQRPNRNLLKKENSLKISSSNKDLPWEQNKIDQTLDNTHNSSTKNDFNIEKPSLLKSSISMKEKSSTFNQYNFDKLYCSIIVYGFDDEYFSLIIEHFDKYGKIMEDLIISDHNSYYNVFGNAINNAKLTDINDDENDASTGINKNKNTSTFPIFLGQGWVKITYDNPNSAIRALADNLTDDGKGNVLGVIPYRRGDLEILLGEKIPDDLNLGEGLDGLSHELELEKTLADNQIGRYLNIVRGGDGLDSINGENRNKSSLTVKDGSKLLLSKQKNTEEKDIWHRGMGFLFGNGEI